MAAVGAEEKKSFSWGELLFWGKTPNYMMEALIRILR